MNLSTGQGFMLVAVVGALVACLTYWHRHPLPAKPRCLCGHGHMAHRAQLGAVVDGSCSRCWCLLYQPRPR